MMQIILDLVLIQIICVLIVDASGFIQELKRGISWIITKGKIVKDDYFFKPFDCSLCCTFWSSLIYFIVTGHFSLMLLAVALFLAIMTPVTKDFIFLMKDIAIYIINKIYDILK